MLVTKAHSRGLHSNAHTSKSHKTRLVHTHDGSQNEACTFSQWITKRGLSKAHEQCWVYIRMLV